MNLISVAQAAELIGCTVGRVRQLLIGEEVAGVKLNGRAWAVDKTSAKQYAKQPQTRGRPRKFPG